MGKKQKENIIREKDSISMTFDFELRVPKKEFDELLRRMANIKKKMNLLMKKLIKKKKKKNRNNEVILIFAAYH